jgi:phosphodiesterase/alkaline phosphatase D-like protein
MDTQHITIDIDKVASGKVNIISFYRKKRLIDEAPLKLKQSSDKYTYKYSHHFDGNDLDRLNNQFPSIFSYDKRKSINDWSNEMKREFKSLIMDGKLDQTKTIDGITYRIQFRWVSE